MPSLEPGIGQENLSLEACRGRLFAIFLEYMPQRKIDEVLKLIDAGAFGNSDLDVPKNCAAIIREQGRKHATEGFAQIDLTDYRKEELSRWYQKGEVNCHSLWCDCLEILDARIFPHGRPNDP